MVQFQIRISKEPEVANKASLKVEYEILKREDACLEEVIIAQMLEEIFEQCIDALSD